MSKRAPREWGLPRGTPLRAEECAQRPRQHWRRARRRHLAVHWWQCAKEPRALPSRGHRQRNSAPWQRTHRTPAQPRLSASCLHACKEPNSGRSILLSGLILCELSPERGEGNGASMFPSHAGPAASSLPPLYRLRSRGRSLCNVNDYTMSSGAAFARKPVLI